MEVKVKIEKTLHTDNDKVFYEDEDIAFEMGKTGDKYIGRIKKIKKKSIIIDNIINRWHKLYVLFFKETWVFPS